MKKVLWIIGIVVVAVLAAVGSFYGGIQYQTNKVDQVQANFERARGQFPGGQPSGDAAGFPRASGQANGQVFGLRNGTMGQVKSVEGNVLTLSTAQDVTTVNLSESTQIQKNTVVTLSANDLLPGVRVMVNGEKDSNGNISANQITILNDMPADAPYPSPTGTEP